MSLGFYKTNGWKLGLLIALYLLPLSACKEKDKGITDTCGIDCKNGGSCTFGTCTCPRGFEGTTCEKTWLSRYLGKWDITETITGSSDSSVRGQTKNYFWQIKQENNNPVRLFIDNFAGNENYNGVSCEIGVNYMGGQDLPTNYIFNYMQGVPNSHITIEKGYGTVNEFGNAMYGYYYTTYVANSVVNRDTINFKGVFVP